jgi:RNA polymerase sigma-70 factor (ECF subfamily)
VSGALAGLDDRELLRRHAVGDPDAFGLLATRHRDRLWRVALRTLGNPEDAADAVQDALLSAYRAAGSFRGDAAVTTWLHRITVNACLDIVRRRASRPSVALEDEQAARDVAAPDALGARETAAEILAALRQIGPEQAAAVVLVDVEGFPVAQVADMLDVPVGTVKSRCARGRARLAALLGHLDPSAVPAPDSAGLPARTGEGNPPRSVPVQPSISDPDQPESTPTEDTT